MADSLPVLELDKNMIWIVFSKLWVECYRAYHYLTFRTNIYHQY